MAEDRNDIEQETQHKKKQEATKDADIEPDEDDDSGIEQETQHEKKAAAQDPEKRKDD